MLLTDLYLQIAIPIPIPRWVATSSKRTYESTRHFICQECLRRNFSINSPRLQFLAGEGKPSYHGDCKFDFSQNARPSPFFLALLSFNSCFYWYLPDVLITNCCTSRLLGQVSPVNPLPCSRYVTKPL